MSKIAQKHFEIIIQSLTLDRRALFPILDFTEGDRDQDGDTTGREANSCGEDLRYADNADYIHQKLHDIFDPDKNLNESANTNTKQSKKQYQTNQTGTARQRTGSDMSDTSGSFADSSGAGLGAVEIFVDFYFHKIVEQKSDDSTFSSSCNSNSSSVSGQLSPKEGLDRSAQQQQQRHSHILNASSNVNVEKDVEKEKEKEYTLVERWSLAYYPDWQRLWHPPLVPAHAPNHIHTTSPIDRSPNINNNNNNNSRSQQGQPHPQSHSSNGMNLPLPNPNPGPNPNPLASVSVSVDKDRGKSNGNGKDNYNDKWNPPPPPYTAREAVSVLQTKLSSLSRAAHVLARLQPAYVTGRELWVELYTAMLLSYSISSSALSIT